MWTTKTLLQITGKVFGGKHANEPFSLGRLALSARRVLIVPPTGLAEMLLMYPALTLLRKSLPESRLICVVTDGDTEIIRNDGIIDDFVSFPKVGGVRGLWDYKAFVADIRERMVEAAFYFDFRQEFYRLILPLLSGAQLRLRLRNHAGHPLFNIEVVPSSSSTYFRDLNLCLVRFLAPNDAEPRSWYLPDREMKIAKEIVGFRKPNPGDLLIGVDLSYGKTGDRPPFEVAVRLARSFAALRPAVIALLSDPDPAIKDEEIRRLGSYDWLDIPRKSFRDTLGILSQCGLFIGANSNLLHFAVAMGVPSFVLFSGKDDRRWIPSKGDFRIVEESTWTTTPPANLAMQMRDFVCAPSRV